MVNPLADSRHFENISWQGFKRLEITFIPPWRGVNRNFDPTSHRWTENGPNMIVTGLEYVQILVTVNSEFLFNVVIHTYQMYVIKGTEKALCVPFALNER